MAKPPSEERSSPLSFSQSVLRNLVRMPRRTWDSLGRRVRRLGVSLDKKRAKLRQLPAKWRRSLRRLPWKLLVRGYWMRLGDLYQYEPRPLALETFPPPSVPDDQLPVMALVTPSFQQAAFIPHTIRSVLDQDYPPGRLRYRVQDGGSTDGTRGVLESFGSRLPDWVSAPDKGQADAVCRGLASLEGDVMAWLNSDDLLMPGALRCVGEFFARHPEIDVVYGHRVLVDEKGDEVGRWVLPPHEDDPLRYADYVPQETLFWRRAIYEKVGGVNPDFHFALDWDLLLRFQKAGARIVRLPYFLGMFRVHPQQKTSAQMGIRGVQEMEQLKRREHGRALAQEEVDRVAHRIQLRAAVCARLLRLGVRW